MEISVSFIKYNFIVRDGAGICKRGVGKDGVVKKLITLQNGDVKLDNM